MSANAGTSCMWNGRRQSEAGTPASPEPTLTELDAMSNLSKLAESMANHRHAMSIGQAQLREQFAGSWEEPEPVSITYNSNNRYAPESSNGSKWLRRTALGAAILGSCGVGALGSWLLSRGTPDPSVDVDTQYILRLGEPEAD